MSGPNLPPYEELVDCHISEEEGLLFIKVVAMPYQDPVEFNTARHVHLLSKFLKG